MFVLWLCSFLNAVLGEKMTKVGETMKMYHILDWNLCMFSEHIARGDPYINSNMYAQHFKGVKS